MIEIPEARIIAKDLRNTILNKIVKNVVVKQNPHNFAFIEGDFNKLLNKKITATIERNYYIEFICEDMTVIMRDGALLRYYKDKALLPNKHQLLIEFDDNSYLVVTVAMYAFISTFKTGEANNKYYELELNGISPLDKKFTFNYFKSLINDDTKKLSAKAFIATEQRIIGIGNGITQDILFNAKISPKTKIKDLNDEQIKLLYNSIINTINEMIKLNGRDTEKDIFGVYGNYLTKMSKKNLNNPCPVCSGHIKKENYLGGSIYYCPNCQKI